MVNCISYHSQDDTHFHSVHGNTAKTLATLEAYCIEQNIRLTPLRKEVLTIILDSNRCIGAYDVLALLKNRSKPAPPTVYRTLDFLLEHGFVHKISALNAYIPCCHPRINHDAAFLICKTCYHVSEYSRDPLFDELQVLLEKHEFQAETTVVEILGLCASCRANAE